MPAGESVRIAAVGDLHYLNTFAGHLQAPLEALADQADVLVLCGDLTDTGLPSEAELLVHELSVVRIPIVAVLGNHDYQSEKEDEVRRILAGAGIHLLDGEVYEIRGVGFAGVKGFAGGFGSSTLAPWGERAVKAFVHEALDETLKLESALARLRTSERIAVLHYAPIQATVEGEPPQIYPFLGNSRLEEPINRLGVTAVFHGHAHRGTPEGRTQANIPVYNVALPLLKRVFPDQPPFRILEVPKAPAW
jgi:Icc-related predicted phosphoesterase